MNYFYTNHKQDIQTRSDEILLFSSIVKQEIITLPGANNLIILRPDRPDLVLAVLLACQDETDQILISKHEEQDEDFLKHFSNVQTIETHHLEEYFKRFQQSTAVEIETEDATKLRQDICHDNQSRLWFRSSGSSGRPKYIQHHFENFILSTKLSFKSYLHVIKDINWALNLSIDHIGGFMALFRSFYLGHRVQHYFWKNPTQNDQSNVFSLVPTQVQWLISQGEGQAAQLLKNADMVVISGGEITKSLVQKLKHFKTKGHVVFTYGATETCSQIAVGFYKDEINQIEYRPFNGVHLEYKNQTTEITSPTNCKKIWEGTLKKIEKVILHDEIIVDDQENRFLVKGRTDEIIVSGGENVSMNKVKEALQKLMPENSFTLIGVPDEIWGSAVTCFSDSPYFTNPTDLKNELKKHLEPYEIPKAFYLLERVSYQGVKPSKEELCQHHNLNKNPWIAFHGFMGHPADWQNLRDQGIENIETINLNDFLHAQNWKDTSDLITNYLQEKYPSQQCINLIGYSMGARVLLSLVRPLRERINRVVIISSQFGDILGSREKMDRKIKDASLFNNISSQDNWHSFLENWYNLELFQGIKNHKQYPELIARRQYENLEQYRKQIDLWTVSSMPNYLLTYPKELIDKTLLITGDIDKKYNDYATNLSKSRNMTHKIIKGHSHALLLSASDQIFECLK